MERADFFFEHVSSWEIMVCKQCRCAVWPSEAAAHLTNKQHIKTQKFANKPIIVENNTKLYYTNYFFKKKPSLGIPQGGTSSKWRMTFSIKENLQWDC